MDNEFLKLEESIRGGLKRAAIDAGMVMTEYLDRVPTPIDKSVYEVVRELKQSKPYLFEPLDLEPIKKNNRDTPVDIRNLKPDEYQAAKAGVIAGDTGTERKFPPAGVMDAHALPPDEYQAAKQKIISGQ